MAAFFIGLYIVFDCWKRLRQTVLSHTSLVLAALLALLLYHPYVGIRHDGVLYAGQALAHLHAEIFALDPFFQFGSQDQYTIFGDIYANLVALWGFSSVAKWGVLICLLGGFGALLGLTLKLVPRAVAGWCLLCVSFSPLFYGDHNVFAIREGFFTARSGAEFLSLLAIMLMVQGRMVWSTGVTLLSGLIHPLMTLPAAGLWFYYQCSTRWGVSTAVRVVGGACLVVAALMFASSFLPQVTMDASWYEVVDHFTPFVLLKNWDWMAQGVPVAQLLILLMVGRLASGELARFVWGVLAVVCAGLMLAVVGEVLQIQLVIAGQLWRVLWLVSLFATLLAPFLVREVWWCDSVSLIAVEPSVRRVAAMLIAGGVFLTFVQHGAAALPILLAFALLSVDCAPVGAGVVRVCGLALGLLVFGVTATQMAMGRLTQDVYELSGSLQYVSVYLKPVVFLMLFVALATVLRDKRLFAMVVLSVSVLFLSIIWDRRDEWIVGVERAEIEKDIGRFVAPRDTVFWPESLELIWLGLRRASYFHNQQSSGVVFSRATALEMKRREDVVKPVMVQMELCATLDALAGNALRNEKCEISRDAVDAVCRSGGPDVLVLPHPVTNLRPVLVWRPSLNTLAKKIVDFDRYVYRCAGMSTRGV